MDTENASLLCLASYEKGTDFLREAKRLGMHVILLTTVALQEADWPRDSIDELFGMPSLTDVEAVINGVSYLARTRRIEHIVPLDEYDGPTAAALREHLQIAGMNVSRNRIFRDKLAMRMQADTKGIPMPAFMSLVHDADVNAFIERVPGPWVLKPRGEVSSIGIAKVHSGDELWQRLDGLGDRRSRFLVEQFVPGDVYHVDSVISDRSVVFDQASKYVRPPMEVFHTGGIAMSRTMTRDSKDERRLHKLNKRVLKALGMEQGVTHMEFIRGKDDGKFYFLEVGARVGGAHTAEMVEAATGINLWREWARVEVLGDRYELPPVKSDYAGVLVSLAREEHPDTSSFSDPEIVYRVTKHHHVGFVVASGSEERVRSLQEEYSLRISQDFAATLPPWEERPPEG